MKKIGTILIFLLIVSLLTINLSIAANKTDAKNLSLNINDALDKDIQVPEGLQLIIKVLFGIERTISISLLIIILAIWLTSFLLFANILKLIPFFKNWTAWAAAVGVTILIALSGTIKNIALFLLNTGDSLSFLAKLGPGALLLILVVIIVIAFFSIKILKIFERYLEKEQAKEEGTQVGTELGFLKRMREMFGFTRKI